MERGKALTGAISLGTACNQVKPWANTVHGPKNRDVLITKGWIRRRFWVFEIAVPKVQVICDFLKPGTYRISVFCSEVTRISVALTGSFTAHTALSTTSPVKMVKAFSGTILNT